MLPLASRFNCDTPITPARASPHRRFGLFPVRSPLLGESLLLSLPAGTKMFQFPAFAPRDPRGVRIAPDGLPHSDIRGSMGICPSPRLFAACHVLLRLREPRHPPCALPTPLCLAGIRDSPPELRGALRASGIQCLPWFARCVVFRTAGASAPPPSRSSFRFQHVNVLPSWRLPDKPRSSGRLCVPVVLGRVELPTSTLSV